jgi:hypothetical protein
MVVHLVRFDVTFESERGDRKTLPVFYVIGEPKAEEIRRARGEIRRIHPRFRVTDIRVHTIEPVDRYNSRVGEETRRISQDEYNQIRAELQVTPAHMTPHLTNTPLNPHARPFFPTIMPLPDLPEDL